LDGTYVNSIPTKSRSSRQCALQILPDHVYVYLTDPKEKCVIKLELNVNTQKMIGGERWRVKDNGREVSPIGLAIDPDGVVWVSAANKIFYRRNGEFVDSKISKLKQPESLAIDKTHLYVNDVGLDQVLIYCRKNGLETERYGTITWPDLHQPQGIFLSSPFIYVCDRAGNFHVFRLFDSPFYGPNGERQSWVHERTWGYFSWCYFLSLPECNVPQSLIIVNDNNTMRMFVADSKNHRIVVFE